MTVLETLQSMFAEKNFIGPDDELREEQRLTEDVGIDSLAMVRLVSAIKSTFGFQVRARDMSQEHFATIGTLVKYIEGRLAEN